MNQEAAVTLLLVMLALSVCFTVSASASNTFSPYPELQQTGNLQQLAAEVPVVVGVGYHSSPTVLDQPTRIEVYGYIRDNPGMHFRGICDGLGLSVGVVQYHLDVLEHAGLIVSYCDGQNRRYFEEGTYTQAQMGLISLVKHECTRQILTILSQGDGVVHRDLASSLGISSQALSWQMNQLKDTGLVNAEKIGVNVRYSLNDAETVRQVLALTGNSRNA